MTWYASGYAVVAQWWSKAFVKPRLQVQILSTAYLLVLNMTLNC